MLLRPAIAASLSSWDEPFVEVAVFGTRAPEVIALAVERFCRETLHATPVDCLRWVSSVGVAMGLELGDGRRVLVKAHQPGVSPAHLAAVHALRERLHASGYPTPAPLVAPRPLVHGLATVEEWLDAPPAPDGFDPSVRRALATGLAELVKRATPLARDLALDGPEVTDPPGDALWPRPHSRLFDFAATAAGAEWIDALARRARDELRASDASPPAVVGHRDWRVEHVRLSEDRIVAVFDWESVVVDTEPRLVGWAAAHWAANWMTGFDGRRAPTPAESAAFVTDYESARGTPFDDSARRAIGAARLYALAYSARCGHHPDRPALTGAAEEALLQHGERYLSLD